MRRSPLISIIIPVVNEAASLPTALARLRGESMPHEIIVAAAPSYDGTAAIAEERGCIVVECAHRNLARQMNLGAACARGEVLVFLHADTILAEGALDKIADALADMGVVGGAFARRYDARSRFLQISCRLAELRSRMLGIFLGDQAIFVRREIFNTLGGFKQIEMFEDFEFSQRLRRAGKTVVLHLPVVSAGRRFYPRGPIVTTYRDFLMTCRYLAGANPHQLALQSYRRGTRLKPHFTSPIGDNSEDAARLHNI